MVPPRFVRDLVVEVSALLPLNTSAGGWTVPSLLVREDCNVHGHLLPLSEPPIFDAGCFRSCNAEPFLFKSWQDTGAWWLCDFSTQLCTKAADTVARWPFLSDFVSSAYFFADVVRFAAQDPEFTAAYRTCAAFTSFYLVFTVAGAFFVLVALPSVLLAVFDTLAAVLVLLTQVSANEAVVAATSG